MTVPRGISNTLLFLTIALVTSGPLVCTAQLLPVGGEQNECSGDTVDQLDPQIARESRAFVAKLKVATEADNRNAVSLMIHYPLAVHIGDGTFRAHSPEEFLHNYDKIINRNVRKAIADPKASRCLFFGAEGFMIGDGEVWFQKTSTGEYKVITINLGEVPSSNFRMRIR